jgi:hypothetical protein
MGCKHLLKSSFISDVDVVKVRPLAANKLNAIQRDFRGVVEIINNNYFVAVFEKSERGEGSNISSPTKEKPVSASFLIIAAPCGRIEIFQARRPHWAAPGAPSSCSLPSDQDGSHRHDGCAFAPPQNQTKALVGSTKFIYEAPADDAKSTKQKGVAVRHVNHCSGSCHLNLTVRESYCPIRGLYPWFAIP